MFRSRRALITALFLILLLLSIGLVLAAQVTCPIDNSGAYFTGKVKTDVSGKLLKLYKCNMYGHEFWVAER